MDELNISSTSYKEVALTIELIREILEFFIY